VVPALIAEAKSALSSSSGGGGGAGGSGVATPAGSLSLSPEAVSARRWRLREAALLWCV